MFRSVCVLTVGLFLLISVVLSSPCVPGNVPDVNLDNNSILSWSRVTNPQNCSIKQYVINIIDDEDGIQMQVTTANENVLTYDMNILDSCKTFSFQVHALTDDNILGPAQPYEAITPIPAGLQLNVTSLTANVDDTSIQFTWSFYKPQAAKCISYYRVIYWDDNNSPSDLYVVNTSFVINGVVPCRTYNLQVSAIITNPDDEGPISEISAQAIDIAPNPPELQSIVTFSTGVTMTWKVEPYSENQCQLQYLECFTLGAPENVADIQVAVDDSTDRPDITVSIDGLEPNTVYLSKATLVNSGGASKNVSIIYQTSDSFRFDPVRDLSFDD